MWYNQWYNKVTVVVCLVLGCANAPGMDDKCEALVRLGRCDTDRSLLNTCKLSCTRCAPLPSVSGMLLDSKLRSAWSSVFFGVSLSVIRLRKRSDTLKMLDTFSWISRRYRDISDDLNECFRNKTNAGACVEQTVWTWTLMRTVRERPTNHSASSTHDTCSPTVVSPVLAVLSSQVYTSLTGRHHHHYHHRRYFRLLDRWQNATVGLYMQ